MQPALGLLRPPPAPRPAVLAQARVRHRHGAVSASDRRVSSLVELVVWDIVLPHVVPYPLAVPGSQRADLEHLVMPVPAHQLDPAPGAALAPSDGADPDVGAGEGLAQRRDLA